MSPHFLFRIERDHDPNNPEAVHPVSEFELATRLSYFLWCSMPDEELFELAEKGELRKPGVLEAQVKRMLKDPKAGRSVENFAGQWLHAPQPQATMTPDKARSRRSTSRCGRRWSARRELFFEHVVREDRSILEFLDADYTFVNDRLAQHYGIAGRRRRRVPQGDADRRQPRRRPDAWPAS